MFSIVKASKDYGWLLALGAALLALTIVYTRPVPSLIPATTSIDKTEILVPLSPGLQSAARICQFGVTKSQPFYVSPPPPTPYTEYVAELGADRLRWIDSGNNRAASLNGEIIILSDEVMKCFRDSR